MDNNVISHCPAPPVHPHACGADGGGQLLLHRLDGRFIPTRVGQISTSAITSPQNNSGSSPRVWGRSFAALEINHNNVRFIPTRVGQMRVDHKRRNLCSPGSSPRVWGR